MTGILAEQRRRQSGSCQGKTRPVAQSCEPSWMFWPQRNDVSSEQDRAILLDEGVTDLVC